MSSGLTASPPPGGGGGSEDGPGEPQHSKGATEGGGEGQGGGKGQQVKQPQPLPQQQQQQQLERETSSSRRAIAGYLTRSLSGREGEDGSAGGEEGSHEDHPEGLLGLHFHPRLPRRNGKNRPPPLFFPSSAGGYSKHHSSAGGEHCSDSPELQQQHHHYQQQQQQGERDRDGIAAAGGGELGSTLLTATSQFLTPPLTPKTPTGGKEGGRKGGGGAADEKGGKGGGGRGNRRVGYSSTNTGLRKQYAPYNEWHQSITDHWRLRAILLIDGVLWDAAVLITVMLNALVLALWRPGQDSIALTLRFCEVFFQICFSYEAFIKLFALGVYRHRLSYFRDGWNVFDFIILIAGWIALYDSTSITHSFTIFGVIRTLRPLRVLRMLPELRRLTGAVTIALPQLLTLASLAFLVFVVFAVLGINLLGGKLDRQCYKPMGGFYQDTGNNLQLCTTSHVYSGGRQCPEGYVCKATNLNPNYGFTSFDNISLAFLTLFQCMTQQGWSDVMYWSRQAVGDSMYLYFTCIIFLSFFLFNLIIVVIIVNYSLSQEQSTVESIKDGHMIAQFGPSSSAVGAPPTHLTPGGPTLLTASSTAATGRPPSLAMMRSTQGSDSGGGGANKNGSQYFAQGVVDASSKTSGGASDHSELLTAKLIAIKAAAKLEILTSPPPFLEQSVIEGGPHSNHHHPPSSSCIQQGKKESGGLHQALTLGEKGGQQQHPLSPHLSTPAQADTTTGHNNAVMYNSKIAEIALLLQRSLKHLQLAPQNTLDPELFASLHKDMQGAIGPARVTFEEAPGTYICAAMANSPLFYHLMNLMTLFSSILLSIAHYGQSQQMTSTLISLNNLLILIFSIESFVKIKGLGWRRFKADGMNTFDLLVVIVSIMELFLGGNSTRSYALRCVRLLRVFSLSRSWNSFRQVLINVSYTASNSVPFMLLLTIFLFVYAIAGMTFLSGKLTNTDPVTGLQVPSRANFDTFYWSIISVFQVMTLDNWNSNMYQFLPVNQLVSGLSNHDAEDDWNFNMHQQWIEQTLYLSGSVLCNESSRRYSLAAGFNVTAVPLTGKDVLAMHQADATLAAVFYVTAVLLGKYVLLNLLTAILVENYSIVQAEETERKLIRLTSQRSSLSNLQTPFDFIKRYLPRRQCSSTTASFSSFSHHDQHHHHRHHHHQLLHKHGRGLCPLPQHQQNSSTTVADPLSKQTSQRPISAQDRLWSVVQQIHNSSMIRVDSLPAFMLASRGGKGGIVRPGSKRRRDGGGKKEKEIGVAFTGNEVPPSGAGDEPAAADIESLELTEGRRRRNSSRGGGRSPAGSMEEGELTEGRRRQGGKGGGRSPAGNIEEEEFGRQEGEEEEGDDGSSDNDEESTSTKGNSKSTIRCCRGCRRMLQRYLPTPCQQWLSNVRKHLRQIDMFCLRLYEHDWFPVVMIVVVATSCIILALDCPGPYNIGPTSIIRLTVKVAEAIFVSIMAFEQVYRVKSLGGVLTYDGSYLTRLWDWFDLLVIASSIAALSAPYGTRAAVSAKVARGFRPVTLVPRVNGLTVVVDTLCQAFKACSGVLCVLGVFYLLFGILGVSLFGGGFYSCNDPERTCYPIADLAKEACPTTSACVGRFYDSATSSMASREWTNPTFSPEGSSWSFDNLPAALLTLFEVASLENWGQIMFQACDVVGPGLAPVRNNNHLAALYFLSFLFIVCFFLQEIFVAVIINNFKRLKRISNGSAFMTVQQREWVRLQKTIKSRHPRIQSPPSPNQPCRRAVYNLVTHKSFEVIVTSFVILNTIMTLTNHFPVQEKWVCFYYAMDYMFAVIYTIEACLRLIGVGLNTYVASKWNCYDGLVTLWGLMMLCLGPIGRSSAFCIVLLRLGFTLRIFRVIRWSSRLTRLCRTFYYALPSLKNIGMFLLLIYYTYAIGGMHLFSTIPQGTYINEDANFSSFGLSFLTLIRCTTGENWNALMHEADKATSPISGKMALLYFCSFVILISYVVLNLFIATMLENFQEDMATMGVITTKHIRAFSRLWTECKKKSLRGDLTKINNRTTKVTTPVMKSNRRRSVRSSVPFLLSRGSSVGATPTTTSNPSSSSFSSPAPCSTGRSMINNPILLMSRASSSVVGATPSSSSSSGPPSTGRSINNPILLAAAAAGGGGNSTTTTAAIAELPLSSTGRRLSIRQRLGMFQSQFSLSSSANNAKEGGGGGMMAMMMNRSGRQSSGRESSASVVIDEEALIFIRLYESSPRYIPIQYLKAFVVQLPSPLGPRGCFEGPITSVRVLEYIRSLEIPVNRYAYVYYQDVLQAALRRAFELKTHIPQAMRLPYQNKQVFLAHEWYAAVAVQSAWRGRSLRTKLSTRQYSSEFHSPSAVVSWGKEPSPSLQQISSSSLAAGKAGIKTLSPPPTSPASSFSSSSSSTSSRSNTRSLDKGGSEKKGGRSSSAPTLGTATTTRMRSPLVPPPPQPGDKEEGDEDAMMREMEDHQAAGQPAGGRESIRATSSTSPQSSSLAFSILLPPPPPSSPRVRPSSPSSPRSDRSTAASPNSPTLRSDTTIAASTSPTLKSPRYRSDTSAAESPASPTLMTSTLPTLRSPSSVYLHSLISGGGGSSSRQQKIVTTTGPSLMMMEGRDGGGGGGGDSIDDEEERDGGQQQHDKAAEGEEEVNEEEQERRWKAAEAKVEGVVDRGGGDPVSHMMALQQLGEEIGPGLPPLEVQRQAEEDLVALQGGRGVVITMERLVGEGEEAGSGDAITAAVSLAPRPLSSSSVSLRSSIMTSPSAAVGERGGSSATASSSRPRRRRASSLTSPGGVRSRSSTESEDGAGSNGGQFS